MKTRKIQTQNKYMVFALSVLAVIALFMFAFNPAVGVATLAITGIAGAVDLTPEEEALKNAILDSVQKALEKNEKGYITDHKLNEVLTAEFKKYAAQFPEAEQVNSLKEAIEGLGAEIKSMKEKGGQSVIYKSVKQQLVEGVGSKSLKELLKNGEKLTIDIDLELANFKTVGTVARPTGTSWLPPAAYDMEWGWTPVNTPKVRTVADVMATNVSRAIWIEGGAREGTAGETGEGLEKNQIDFTPVMASMDAKKVTAYVNFTEEMLDDMPSFMAELEREMMNQINTKEDSQFLVGTGLTIYLKGVTAYAQAYTLTTVKTASPNNYDCIIAAMTQVKKYNFIPNAVFMNPIDTANMRLQKGASDGHYSLVTPTGELVPGITVVESNNIAVGKLLVGDFLKYHIRDYKNLQVRFGYTGTNFVNNIQTAIAEKRVITYVKGGEEYAFVYDDFTDIKAAITPAS